MTFQYSRCVNGVSFWPDIEIPVRAAFFRALKYRGFSWVGLTCGDRAWNYMNWHPAFDGPRFPGVTSWVEQANAAGLRTVVRGAYWIQDLDGSLLSDPSHMDEVVLAHAKTLVNTSYYMNAFQPVAEWPIPPTQEGADRIAAWNASIAPKIREILPSHTIIFSPPAWGHIAGEGYTFMPALPDKNAAWGFDLYGPTPDDPQGINDLGAWLNKRGEKALIMECGLSNRLDLSNESAMVDAYKAVAQPWRIPVSAWKNG